MLEVLSLLAGTVILRPYVFVLLALYLVIGSRQIGWRGILLFTVLGYLIAFTSEYFSTRWGIPYGYYFYIDVTRGRELWISNVPFMDSLSYSFLSYLSYIFALVVLRPAKWTGRDVVVERQNGWKVLFLGAFFFMMADVMIDPITLQGHRWFLGQIYGYPEIGIHFGVPISNYIGWYIVGVAIIGAWMVIDGLLTRVSWLGKVLGVNKTNMPLGLYAVLLYFCIVLFNCGITVWIGEYFMALVNFIIVVVPLGTIFGLRLWRLAR